MTAALAVIVLGGPTGLVTGAIAAVAVDRSFRHLEGSDARDRRARLIADLPIAVDLLGACLRGGTPWNEALDAVAGAVGGPLEDELRGVGTRIRLGADPADAWAALAADPTLAPLARTAVRTARSGAAMAPTLARLARDQRRTAGAAAAARARSAGILALLPLGLCFLPAFVFLGIVPAVVGIAATLDFSW
ncbi:type II secretion system F family protein [Actinomadura parmotrematis]|nr:type II secretion system F family protein [Actinomadura parmotrematis]